MGDGGMAERLNAPALKAGDGVTRPRVRIPLPPLQAGVVRRERRGRPVGDERLRQDDRAVVALAVLEQRDDRAADGDGGAVERVQRLGLAAARAAASGSPGAGPGSRSCSRSRSARGTSPGWGSTPRSRTCAPPSCPGRRSRCRRRGRGARAPGGSPPRSPAAARARPSRLDGLDEAEHLDLVELVDAEDAARVAAGRTRLAAEARGEAGVAQRQVARPRRSRRRAARRAPPRSCRRGTARPRGARRSAARCRGGSRSRRAPPRGRAPAG